MVIVEIDSSEFEKHDFDFIWDEVRDIYQEEFYSLKKIEKEGSKFLVKLNVLKSSNKK
jgi:hypothetical protein